jgi:hypothetical protein
LIIYLVLLAEFGGKGEAKNRLDPRDEIGDLENVLEPTSPFCHDRLNPKITLISDTGITLTNISESGRKMKNKYLHRVDLGRSK